MKQIFSLNDLDALGYKPLDSGEERVITHHINSDHSLFLIESDHQIYVYNFGFVAMVVKHG